jgi:hypothetical protein
MQWGIYDLAPLPLSCSSILLNLVIMEKSNIKNMLLQYLFLKKKNPNAPDNANIRLMHGMNRISILVFLFALVVMVVRAFR